MPRASAVAVRAVLEAPESGVALLGFLVITHPNLPEPIRLVSDVFSYVRGGHTYIGVPFGFSVVTDGDGPPETQLRAPNTDRRIGQALRGMTGRAQVALEVLASTDFDLTQEPRTELGVPAPVMAFTAFELIDVEVNPAEITGRVFLRDFAAMPYGLSATQVRCPGLYR